MSEYFSSGVNAPQGASYAAPLLNFGGPGGITNQLLSQKKQIQDQSYTQGLRTAFPDGIPKLPDGSPDIATMTDTLAKLGGAENAMPLVNMAIQSRNAQANQGAIDGATQQQPQPGSSQPTQQPARVPVPPTGIPVSPQGNNTPPPAGQQGDNGQNTIMSIVAGQVGDEQAGKVALRVAGMLKLDPNQPITPAQMPAVARAMRAAGLGGGQPQDQGIPQPDPQQDLPLQAQPVQSVQATPQGAPTGSPVQPNASGPQLPYNQSLIDGLEAKAAGIRRQSVAYGEKPEDAKALISQAEAIEGRTKIMREANAKTVTPTPEMLNANASGASNPLVYQQQQEQQKNEVDRFGKRYDAINKAGNESALELPQLQVAKTAMSDPNFFSGPTAGINTLYKRWLANLGGDPNAAMPNEAFGKIVQNSILSQIRSMAGTGQIRVAEIKIMEKAAANQDYSPSSNRLLVEIASRLHQHALDVQNLASQYKGGHLDPGFDQAQRQMDQQHPIFSPQELQNPKLIAPPIARSPADFQRYGLKPGDPFQSGFDGSIKYVKQPGAQQPGAQQ